MELFTQNIPKSDRIAKIEVEKLKRNAYLYVIDYFNEIDFINLSNINKIIDTIEDTINHDRSNQDILEYVKRHYISYLESLKSDIEKLKLMFFLKLLSFIYIEEQNENRANPSSNHLKAINLNAYFPMFINFFGFNSSARPNVGELTIEELDKIKSLLFPEYSKERPIDIPINIDILIVEIIALLLNLYSNRFTIKDFYEYILVNKFGDNLIYILSALINSIYLNHKIILNNDGYNLKYNVNRENYSEYLKKEKINASNPELKKDIEALIYFFELFQYYIPKTDERLFRYLIDSNSYNLDTTYLHISDIYKALNFHITAQQSGQGGKKINKKKRNLKTYV
jgi:hypothetical protein